MSEPIAVLLPHGADARNWELPGIVTDWLDIKFCGGLAQPFILYSNGWTQAMQRKTEPMPLAAARAR